MRGRWGKFLRAHEKANIRPIRKDHEPRISQGNFRYKMTAAGLHFPKDKHSYNLVILEVPQICHKKNDGIQDQLFQDLFHINSATWNLQVEHEGPNVK
jgi:hypothetical protein